jgi:non-heme chloroperoxidase
MGLVEVEAGVRLFVTDVGAGRPVVLVAGFGLDHRVWQRQVESLSRSYRVICVDQRGHGYSDKPEHGYGVSTLADDLIAVFEELDVVGCALVGWSFGGQVAFRAAALAPRRVAALALVGSNGVRASRSDGFPFGRSAADVEGPLIAAEMANRVVARRDAIASGFASEPDPQVLGWLLGLSLSMPSYAAADCYRSMLNGDLLDCIDLVKVPVLQLIGAQDPVHSARGARWLNQRLADSELVELAGCGHYPMLEAPADFDLALRGFLARTG